MCDFETTPGVSYKKSSKQQNSVLVLVPPMRPRSLDQDGLSNARPNQICQSSQRLGRDVGIQMAAITRATLGFTSHYIE